jgi:TolB protein
MKSKSILLFAIAAALANAQTQPVVSHGAQPVVSPDGSHIAFLSNRTGADELFVISTDGTGETQLTFTSDEVGNPAWTANGKQILFALFAKEISHLYSIDPDGKNLRDIASVLGRTPTLSPDGKKLLYMSGTWTATRLMLSQLSGSNARQINDGSSIAWNNHWSPDGKRIAFTSRNGPNGELAIFIMNADGTHRRQLSHFAPDSGNAQWPMWSPDGRQLAIQVNGPQKNDSHIWILDVATGEARKLAAPALETTRDGGQPYLDETPSWFPDGQRLAFQSNRTGRMEVWTMNADGSAPHQITR